METVAVLFNPSSGRGKSQKKKNRIESRFLHFGIPTRWFFSQSEAHLKELARSLAHNYSMVTAVGGDTTFTLAATEFINLGVDVSLGIVGTGSANDISRGLGVYDLDVLCEAILAGRMRRMDAGCLHLPGRPHPLYFMGALSLGLGVDVNLFIAAARRRFPLLNRGGSAVQALTGVVAMRHAFSRQSVPDRIQLKTQDHGKEVYFSLALFANTPYYANGVRLLPDATPFDGRLHCCIIHTSSLSQTLRLSRKLLGGRHTCLKEVDIIAHTAFQVVPASGSIALQYDGEVITGIESFRVEVRPSVLKTFTASDL